MDKESHTNEDAKGELSFAESLSNAIRDKEKGSRRAYDRICAELKQNTISDSSFQDITTGFRFCIPCITKEHETLVTLFLNLDWTSRTPELMVGYTDALTDLLANQTQFCKLCVQSLVFKLKSQSASENVSALSLEFQNIHLVMAAISRVVPTSSSLIFETLAKNFPYMNKSSDIITNYAKNLLYMCSYSPGISQHIWNLLIDNMLKIDVAISREDLILIFEHSNRDPDTQFTMELAGSQLTDKNMIKCVDLAMKLDNLMVCVLENIKNTCLEGDQKILNLKGAKCLWFKLEQSFSSIILATFNCSHVQYAIFYICSLDKALSDRFLQLCWHHIQDPSVSVFFSQIACAYIGGMLTRAKYITLSTVKKWLSVLVDYVHQYIDSQDNDVVLFPTKHKLFYQLCQHIFYVVSFHHADLCVDQKGVDFLKKLSFERIIMSRLNPLRFCLPSVADVFARVTRFHQITFCYTVLERNKRSLLQMQCNDLTQKETQIHTYFPFEPYLLEHSKSWIEPLYRHWDWSLEEVEDSHPTDDDHYMDEVVRSFENRFSIHLGKMGSSLDPDISMSPPFSYDRF